MVAWFSGEPRFLSRFSEWAERGPYVLRRTSGTYAFPEVPHEIGLHFTKQGDYETAYVYLSPSLSAGPSIETAELLLDVCKRTRRTVEADRLRTMIGRMRE